MGTCAETTHKFHIHALDSLDIQINGSWFAVVAISSFFVVGLYP